MIYKNVLLQCLKVRISYEPLPLLMAKTTIFPSTPSSAIPSVTRKSYFMMLLLLQFLYSKVEEVAGIMLRSRKDASYDDFIVIVVVALLFMFIILTNMRADLTLCGNNNIKPYQDDKHGLKLICVNFFLGFRS